MTFIHKMRTIVAVMILITLGGCAAGGGGSGTEQEQLLQRSVQALNEKEQYSFTGTTQVSSAGVPVQTNRTFEGYVTGGDQLFVREASGIGSSEGKVEKAETRKQPLLTFNRVSDEWSPAGGQTGVDSEKYRQWNPVAKLQELEGMPKTVRLDHEQPKNQNEQVLRIDLADEAMTKQVISSLQAQQAQLSLERELESLRLRGLSETQLQQAEEELRRVISRSEASLEEMLKSLKAQGTYRLWLDRTTKLPRKLTTDIDMSYLQDGVQRTETARAEYHFKDYDKKSLSFE